MQKEVQDWLEQAKADLKTSKDMITTQNYYARVSFSQQAAEKALKAVLVSKTQEAPPKIHDLLELARKIKAPKVVVEAASKLTVTYFSSRYPGTAPDIPVRYYTKLKAETHLKEAEVILEWVYPTIQ